MAATTPKLTQLLSALVTRLQTIATTPSGTYRTVPVAVKTGRAASYAGSVTAPYLCVFWIGHADQKRAASMHRTTYTVGVDCVAAEVDDAMGALVDLMTDVEQCLFNLEDLTLADGGRAVDLRETQAALNVEVFEQAGRGVGTLGFEVIVDRTHTAL